jgi:hypothetical protein
VLFQFAERDYCIAPMSVREFARAAPEGSAFEMYDTGHDMRLAAIRVDRRAFLARTLGVVVGDVVDSRAGHDASDRGVRTSVIVEVDEAAEGVDPIAV